MARILAVADCYEVMTSGRPIQNKRDQAEAVAVLEKNKGILFDPRVVEVFIEKVLPEEQPEQRACSEKGAL